MGMTFTTRARSHPSTAVHTHGPLPAPPLHAITHIYTEGGVAGAGGSTVGLSGVIMKRPSVFGRGRMMN